MAPLTPPLSSELPPKCGFLPILDWKRSPMAEPLYAICGDFLGDPYLNGFGLRLLRFGEMEHENALFKDNLHLRVVHQIGQRESPHEAP